VTLNEADLDTLRDAIEDLYYFEFVIGNLTSLYLIPDLIITVGL